MSEYGYAELLRMRQRIEELRGALKCASGWFFEAGMPDFADCCLDFAGDMEPRVSRPEVDL